MTTVAEMIEWLKKLPQDSLVECGEEYSDSWGVSMQFTDVDLKSCEVFDFTDPKYDTETYKKYSGKRIVRIRASQS